MSSLRNAWGWSWLVIGGLALSAQAAAPLRLTERRAVELALEQNPGLRSGETRLTEAEGDLAAARAALADNPELELAVGPRQGSPALDVSVTLVQPLELGGHQGWRRKEADATLEETRARRMADREELATRVRIAFGRLLAAQAREALGEASHHVARETLATAQARFEVGDASQIEVNAARVEQSRVGYRLGQLRLATQEAEATFHRLLGVNDEVRLELVGTLEPPSGAVFPDDPAPLIARALDTRPEVIAAREAVRSAEAAVEVAEREARPRAHLGVMVGQEERAAYLQGLVGITLPAFDRNQAARGESTGRLRRARLAQQELERRIAREVRLALQREALVAASARTFAHEALKAADANVALASEAHRAGEMDFLQLMLLRREAIDAHVDHIGILEALHIARAERLRALGEALAPPPQR